jgi:hypothetical protein
MNSIRAGNPFLTRSFPRCSVAKHDIFTGGFYMVFFLVFFWVVVDQMQVRHRYELEGAMLGPATAWTESTDISDISTMDDVWDWLKVAAVPLVFPVEQWYNGEAWTAKEKGFLLNFNRLVGGILQATAPTTCVPIWSGTASFLIILSHRRVCRRVAQAFSSYKSASHPTSTANTPADSAIGPAAACPVSTTLRSGRSTHSGLSTIQRSINLRKFTRNLSLLANHGSILTGTHVSRRTAGAVTDDWAGYRVQFPLDRKLAYRKLAELKADKFLSKETRELRLDFTVYNENKRLFCSVTYVIAFFESGMVQASVNVGSVNIENYDGFSLRLLCEILVCIKVVLQCVDEMREAWEIGLIQHFYSLWNWIDFLRIFFFVLCITCYAQMLNDPVAKRLTLPLPADQIFVDFSNLSTLTQVYVRRCAVTILLCLMSVLKYMRHSQTYGTLAITLSYAGPEILRFLLMFSLVNMTFTVMGLLMFGNQLEEFSTISASLQTLVMMMTGEVGYERLQAVNETSALTFYSFYLILVFFILVNMFLAIVFDAYATLQEARAETVLFPYRYSYLQEEILELRRDYGTTYPRLCGSWDPEEFFLTTEEMHALLTDPIKLGSADIGEQREVADVSEATMSHVVHADMQIETVICKQDMIDIGWTEQHVLWLLSQIGVPDDQSRLEEEPTSGGSFRQNRRRGVGRSLSMTSAYNRKSVEINAGVDERTDGQVRMTLARGSGSSHGAGDSAGSRLDDTMVASVDTSADKMEALVWSETLTVKRPAAADDEVLMPNGNGPGVSAMPLPGRVEVVDGDGAATEPPTRSSLAPPTTQNQAKEGLVALRSETRMMREVIALRTDTRAIVAAAKDEIITELGARLDESEVSNRQMVEALEGLQLQLQHLQATQTAAAPAHM